MVWAETAGANPDSVVVALVGGLVVANGSLVGALIWFMRHMIMRTLPQVQRSHIEMIDSMRKECRQDSENHLKLINSIRAENLRELDIKRKDFVGALEAERVMFREELKIIRNQDAERYDKLFRETRTINHSIMAIRDRGCATGPLAEKNKGEK